MPFVCGFQELWLMKIRRFAGRL